MTRWIGLAGILLLGLAAIVLSERRRVDAEAGPAAVLYLIGDTERELTRMPVRFTRMSDAEEIRAGDEIARYYNSTQEQKPTPEDVLIQDYVSRVGAQLAAGAHRKLPYRFHYIREKYFVNAFALPGGHVYIGQGLLDLMDSEDELASVLGHEIEHIDHYHCAERVQQEQALRKIPLGGLVALPIEIFEAGYSKDQELEADREGTRLAVKTGYSPNGTMRMFETFQRLYEEYETHARTPEEELSNLAQQTLGGYFRSHPLPKERIAQIRQMIASEGWSVPAERDQAVAFVFWTSKAEDALKAHQYAQAQQIALRSLQMRPGRERALWVLGRAQFAQANFLDAAASLRKALAIDHSDGQLIREYALALAAADHKSAAAEFSSWAGPLKEKDDRNLQIISAGLALLAGNPEPARTAAVDARNHLDQEWAPEWLGDLGGWYYMAGDYATALGMLNDAVQQRPEEPRFLTGRAWVQIQNRTLADALQGLDSVNTSQNATPDTVMSRAVAQWLAQERVGAMANFSIAINQRPEWTNPRWAAALYSPLVVDTVQQMEAERQRREKAAKKK